MADLGTGLPWNPSWWVAGPGVARLQAGPGLPLVGGASPRPPGQPDRHNTALLPPGNRSCCPARTLLPPGQAQPWFPISARPACGPLPVRPPCREGPVFSVSPGAVSPPPGSPHKGCSSASSLFCSPDCTFCLWCSGSCPVRGLDRAPCVGLAAHQGKGLDQWLKGSGLSKLVMGIHRAGLSGSRASPILRDLFEEGSGTGGTAQLAGSQPLMPPAGWNHVSIGSGCPRRPRPRLRTAFCSPDAARSPGSRWGRAPQAGEQGGGGKGQSSRTTGHGRDSPRRKPGWGEGGPWSSHAPESSHLRGRLLPGAGTPPNCSCAPPQALPWPFVQAPKGASAVTT